MGDILSSLGIGGAESFSNSVDTFQAQNATIGDILGVGSTIPRTLGGIPGIGSRIPGVSNIPIPGISAIDKVFAPLQQFKFGADGEWESLQYADDLNYHHPKLKFLFKVNFSGFCGREFYYYVLRADKPKVKYIHQDVNYYNFRTRVLTGVTYDPLTLTFFDEIGNDLYDFFTQYLALHSGTGAGYYGIEQGFGQASSSKPYSGGYSMQNAKIIIEQIFINQNVQSNRFEFINPRIESFDFDDLSMEESSVGSHATITFSYDAINCYSVYGSTINSWGNTDLLAGGGTSGNYNAGSTDGIESYAGGSLGKAATDIYNTVKNVANVVNNVPNAIAGLILNTPVGIGTSPTGGNGSIISSVGDTISQGIQGTLRSITSGANAIFGGKEASSNPVGYDSGNAYGTTANKAGKVYTS